MAAGVTAEEYQKFILYVAGFYGNMSNYYNFGAMKFVPDLSMATFKKIIYSNPLYGDPDAFYREVVDEIYPQIEVEIFIYEAPFMQLQFPEEGGVTAYFGRNLTQQDLDLCVEFLDSQKVSILNTRTFKENGKFIITVGSVSRELTRRDIEFKGAKFDIEYGEFAPYLEEANYYLGQALKYCANENQENMVKKYIESYETGSIDAHKESQKFWVRDMGPVVETNMGYIESYIDPSNMRAYWEGMVAIVDKEQSKKFNALV